MKIPTSSNENYINYIVLNNDTLYSIAKKYNVSIDTIKSLNNLYTNLIIPGQVLKIPTSSSENYIEYTVKNNDTLYSIAKRYNTTVNNIKLLNNLTSNFLSVGMLLKIPV